MIGELTRLYQAALEEQRIVHNRSTTLAPREALEALEHINHEVHMAHGALLDAFYGVTA